ncbi:hypothetical protein BDU57DRAFT_517672 [Ampelomyces quisqualis]|uniref:Uncharacterized protein n=1 Tax=Ampelomyces quisqualis TaxID=50730 RepID=A0A6A5QMZ7_AMPQU|nr:hypothetical protein BDU57DRAFT_517672 [Ampelomyces quisqualis]
MVLVNTTISFHNVPGPCIQMERRKHQGHVQELRSPACCDRHTSYPDTRRLAF